jgi:hypothetical protein
MLWAVFGTATAYSAPGFIGGSRVTLNGVDDQVLASIEIRFNCKVQYVRHDPNGQGDRLRILLEPTSICNGVSPLAAATRSRLRPVNADDAHLVDLEYDGNALAGSLLTLSFSEPVAFAVDTSGVSFELRVEIRELQAGAATAEQPSDRVESQHRRVDRPQPASPGYVLNLVSLRHIPSIADAAGLQLAPGQTLSYSETVIDGATWYRLRLGTFETVGTAKAALNNIAEKFPGAWIDQLGATVDNVDLTIAARELAAESMSPPESAVELTKVDSLMEDARRSMIAGDTSRAVQIYTKVLQLATNSRQPEAQEFLAFAREKNGQMAHAIAEYRRYLSLFPDGDGAVRVNQRLAALLANNRPAGQPSSAANVDGARIRRQSPWRIQTYFSQYYRRDVNQPNDQDEIVSQSALYSDINFDARRRGQRFDFSSRLSAGYRNDLLNVTTRSNFGNSARVSYAYVDLVDADTGLRGRAGRQSRNSGGVLGRFDGLNLGYQANEKFLFSTVLGKPAYSTSDSIDSSRTFYGASVNYVPEVENLDLGLFYVQQDIEGIRDRQAVGGEFRYFGTNKSLWGLIDYDLHFGELASTFLQGSWRFESRLSIHATINQRGSPFLSTGNAIIGQPVTSFAELKDIFSAEELIEIGRDRTAASTNYSIGASYPITPRFQVNGDAGQSTIDGTPASGGVLETVGSTYTYYSGSLVASSLLKEGDVSIFGLRYSSSDTSQIASVTFDSRYPLGRTWRINARLRVDRREIMSSASEQWLYSPGLRIQYRRSQKFRLELELGKQFSEQDSLLSNQDRESYFINLGYQAFF